MEQLGELAIKVGNNPKETGLKEGDIMHALPARQISWEWAVIHCNKRNMEKNSDGYRVPGSLYEQLLDRTMQYKYLQVGVNHIRKFDLWNREYVNFGKVDSKRQIERMRRESRTPNHLIFGTENNIYNYKGRQDISEARLQGIWENLVTPNTGKERQDYTQYPWNDDFLKMYYILPVSDFEYQAKWEMEEKVEVDTGKVDRDGLPIMELVKARKRFIDLFNKTGMSPKTVNEVKDKEKKIDMRGKFVLDSSTLVEVKA